MAESRNSLRGAIDAKCRDCGGTEGGNRHWRQHVAACPVTGCALWCVRPLPECGPGWLMARTPDRLPHGWRNLSLDAAVAFVRGVEAVAPPVLGGISMGGSEHD